MSTTEARLTVEQEAEGLHIGSSRSIDCPFCRGGVGGDDKLSMSITRTQEGILFYCFRVSCGAKGICRQGELWGPIESPTERPKPTRKVFPPFKGELGSLLRGQVRDLCNHYGLTEESIALNNWRWSTKPANCLYMPYYSAGREPWGYGLKNFPWAPIGIKQNYFTSKEGADVRMAFPKRGYDGPMYDKIVLVEDLISAISLTPDVFAVALCGTNITDEGISYLQKYTNKVILCLDPDTWSAPVGQTPKIWSMHAKLKLHFDFVNVVKPWADPKDCASAQREALIKELRK